MRQLNLLYGTTDHRTAAAASYLTLTKNKIFNGLKHQAIQKKTPQNLETQHSMLEANFLVYSNFILIDLFDSI